MALSSLSLSAVAGWALTNANTGFAATTQGPDTQSFDLSGVSTTTFNEIFVKQYSIAAAGTQDVDLTALTDLVYQSVTLKHALFLMIVPTGGSITVTPNVANGLVWFFGASTDSITIPAGGVLVYSEPAAGPGAVVDATHKVLHFSNGGATTTTLNLIIAGGTT